MKRWPQPDGDKVQTIGVKLLKMLLSEMEARKVGKDKLEKMVSHALAGLKEKHNEMEREKKQNGDAFDGIKFKAAEVEKGGYGFEDNFENTEVENRATSESEKDESTEIEEGEIIEGVQSASTKMDMDHVVDVTEVEHFPELGKGNAVESMEPDYA
jgi:Skp family chaperone for outer membrane proteins